MARIQIPLDVLTSRLNLSDRFSSFRSGSLQSRFSNLRPISEFLDFKRLSKPENFSDMQSRVNYNLGHFSSNYAVVFVLLSVYALITNWLLMFDIVYVFAGMWFLGRLEGRDLQIGSFHATSSQMYTGLLVSGGLIGLIASPFSTLLWLIGASGFFWGGGLGGRPRAPKHAPQWGRPSRRGRRKWAAPPEDEHDVWATGQRVVEELDSDDTDTQGVGLLSGNKRFASDPLQFTGVDLGGGRSRRRHAYQPSEDDESTEEDSDSEEDTEDEVQIALREKEEALVQSALARIRRAQAKGKQEVKLNKEELAALERRRQRLQAEAAKNASKASSADKKRRKEKEQRYTVPISHFESAPPTKKNLAASNDSLPRHPSPKVLADAQERSGYPPKGYFPPPNTSRNRPRSATSASQRPSSGHGGSSPFDYSYVQGPPPTSRHVSDPSARPRSSRSNGPLPHEDSWRPPSSSRNQVDPFVYQTAGPRAPYVSGAAAARRNVSGPAEMAHRRAAPAAARSSPRMASSDETSESEEDEDEDSTSDDLGNGAHIGIGSRENSREHIVVEEEPSPSPEPEPEPERPRAKKTSSPSKRKPVAGGRRRKGK